jgi:hypothetical protein
MALAWACASSESKAPPAGGGGGTVLSGRTPSPSNNDDAGADPDDDAGSSGITVGLRCDNIEPATGAVDPDPGTLENEVTAPGDFTVTRLQTRWLCDPDEIEITLSDGRCPNGRGHELVLTIDAAALEDGAVVGGQNVLMPEPDQLGLRLRYTRPFPAIPQGEWGTCAGASGTVDFLQEPETRALSTIQARVVADLTACDESGAPPTSMAATIQALVPTARETACPTD